MSLTYEHLSNVPNSWNGYITRVTDSDGLIIEVYSELNNDGEVNETISEKKALKAYQHATTVRNQIDHALTVDGSTAKDVTYMNGSAARTDYAVGTTEGQAIVTQLETTWPDEVSSYSDNPLNLVAEYSPTRPPYTNDSISFYHFEAPSNSIKTTFNANYEKYNNWYGLKFDKVTEDVLAKFVIPSEEMERVDIDTWNEVNDKLPSSSHYHFYARIHDKSNNINENIDVYFQADPSDMKAWCTENSYTFPYDNTDASIAPLLTIWGCVYNTSTKVISHVKAYTRTTA